MVSDIPANKEVDLPSEQYFRCGDIDDLKEKMEALLEVKLSEREKEEIRSQIKAVLTADPRGRRRHLSSGLR